MPAAELVKFCRGLGKCNKTVEVNGAYKLAKHDHFVQKRACVKCPTTKVFAIYKDQLADRTQLIDNTDPYVTDMNHKQVLL